MRIKCKVMRMWIAFYLFFNIFISTINIFAQNANDCIIYENVLLYLNKKEAELKIVYRGIIDPESGDIGTPVVRDKGLYQHNFYIVDEKSNYGYSWFSEFMKDSTIIHKNYIYDNDSIINCTFDNTIKYQYKPFIEIRFSEKDYLQEKIGETDVYYSPMRVTFSKVLYTNDDRALVFARIYQGIGGGRDRCAYGFVFNKNNDDWVLSLVEVKTG